MKRCNKCKELKSINDFGLTRKDSGVRRASCKKCSQAAHEIWRRANKEKIRESWNKASSKYYSENPDRINLWKSYGMTIEDFNSLLESQNGKCAICNLERKLCVDHCHETGKIRGLLCIKCNTALGSFGDSVEGLSRAIEYLAAGQVTEKHS